MTQITELIEGTLEYVRTPICATKSGVSYDPTGDTVQFAFCPAAQSDDPPVLTWYPGQWQTVGGVYYAECLVGGAVPVAHGTYEVFVKVTDSPEIPMKSAGLLKVR